MQWKPPDDAGVAELNGRDTASEELSWMDLQAEATAMEVREVLSIGRVRNSENFFGGLHLTSFSVFHHIIVFCPVLSYHNFVASSSGELFRFDSLFFSTTILQKDPAPSGGITGSGPW